MFQEVFVEHPHLQGYQTAAVALHAHCDQMVHKEAEVKDVCNLILRHVQKQELVNDIFLQLLLKNFEMKQLTRYNVTALTIYSL